MIKSIDFTIDKYDEKGKAEVVTASLVADNKSEVINMGNISKNIEGIEDGVHLSFGSDCFTVDKELGLLNSENNWIF